MMYKIIFLSGNYVSKIFFYTFFFPYVVEHSICGSSFSYGNFDTRRFFLYYLKVEFSWIALPHHFSIFFETMFIQQIFNMCIQNKEIDLILVHPISAPLTTAPLTTSIFTLTIYVTSRVFVIGADN